MIFNCNDHTKGNWIHTLRADSLAKTLMLGKIEGKRRRGQQRLKLLIASLTQWT